MHVDVGVEEPWGQLLEGEPVVLARAVRKGSQKRCHEVRGAGIVCQGWHPDGIPVLSSAEHTAAQARHWEAGPISCVSVSACRPILPVLALARWSAAPPAPATRALCLSPL